MRAVILRVLGIDIASSEIRWIGIEGTSTNGILLPQSSNSVPLPTAEKTELKNLLRLKELIAARLSSGNFQKVGIVRADRSASSIRVKCELIIEIACDEVGIDCELLSTATISAADKRKIAAKTGSSFEEAFNNGDDISPKYLRRAAVCAWCVL